MASNKISRKKLLKEPDEFLTFSERAVEWAQVNYRLLLYGVGAVAVIVAGVVALSAYLDHQEDLAAQALSGTFAAYTQAVEGQAAPEALDKAREDLKKVVADYGSTPAGVQARLALGDLLLERGQYAEAEPLLTGLTEEEDLPAELKSMAWHGLGVAREGQKQYAPAAQAYAQARTLAGPTLSRAYLLDQARATEAAGDKAGAEKLYREILTQQGKATQGMASLGLPGQGTGGQEAELARSRLVALGVDPASL